MVGHSCNAGAHAIEWREEKGGGAPGRRGAPTTMHLDYYYVRSLFLALCINRGTIASPGSGVGSRPDRLWVSVAFPLLPFTPRAALREYRDFSIPRLLPPSL